MAKEAGIEGMVVVRVLVDKQGKYEKHMVLKNPHPILTQAVENKLSKLVFKPAIVTGRPADTWVTLPIKFQLK